MKDVLKALDKLNFDDNLGDELGCGKVEVTEVTPTGDVVDVVDAYPEELGKLSASFKITGLKSAIKTASKVKGLLKKAPKVSAIVKVRTAKAMPKIRPAKKVVAVPRKATVHPAIFAGTNARLSTIASLLKKQSVSKQATNEHKSIVKRDNFRKQVLGRLSTIENKLACHSREHAMTRKACGIP